MANDTEHERELRRQALQLVGQLPPEPTEALRVLEEMRLLVTGYLMDPPDDGPRHSVVRPLRQRPVS